MIEVQNWLDRDKADGRVIMQVHDELVFEVAQSEIDAFEEQVITIMSAAADLTVPLRVDAGRGANWDEAH
jgi:DNA polymerase-1